MSARYVPLVKIASGGMATVYVGTLRGDLGFRRLVAIKRPHPHLAEDPDFRASLLEEAHVAARVRHANVASVLDVEVAGDDVQLVMDYVEGATLSQLLSAASKRGEKLPPGVVLRIALDACAGLAAVHEARDEHGASLGLVHRDVSPQNLLVGLDGLARISDFGTAKSALEGRPSTTQGTLKGKLAYMAPEYVGRGRLDLRVDVFAMGVVLWESLAGKRLFRGANDADTLDRVQREEAPPLSDVAPELGAIFDEAIARALVKLPEERWSSVEALGAAIAAVAGERHMIASHAEVARVVRSAVEPELEARRADVRARLAEMDAAPGSRRSAVPVLAGGAVPAQSQGERPVSSGGGVPEATVRSADPVAREAHDPTRTVREGARGGRWWLLAAIPLAVIGLIGGIRIAGDRDGGEADPAGSVVTATATATATTTAIIVAPADPAETSTAPAGAAPAETSVGAAGTAPSALTVSGSATPAGARTSKPVAPPGSGTSAPAAPPSVSSKRKAPPNPYGPK